MSQSMNDEGVCRSALATPGLLIKKKRKMDFYNVAEPL